MKFKSLILIVILISYILAADKVITIFIAGDSTAAERDTSNDNPERGWGQMLQNYFNKNFVVVDNHAIEVDVHLKALLVKVDGMKF